MNFIEHKYVLFESRDINNCIIILKKLVFDY